MQEAYLIATKNADKGAARRKDYYDRKVQGKDQVIGSSSGTLPPGVGLERSSLTGRIGSTW